MECRQRTGTESKMAAKRGLFILILKLIFLGQFCSIYGTESTVFTEEEANKDGIRGPTLSTTGTYGSASIEDLFTGNLYRKQTMTETKADTNRNSIADSFDEKTNELDATASKTNTDDTQDNPNAADEKLTSDIQSRPQDTVDNSDGKSENVTHLESHNTNQTLPSSRPENISELAGNSTNKTVKPFWSCVKYNTSQQTVIVLKDKKSLIWWLDELNKTMSCAVVLFYAKWCYFSTSLAPMYNAVGRAFSGIPILAIDAYTHNTLNTRYGIVGVPTIILFQESRPVARFNRTRTFKDLVEFIHQSTGMEYNTSVEVSEIDYEEGPLPSVPSEEVNIYLLASLCFLISLGVFALWRLQYVQGFVEYFMSLAVVRKVLRSIEREKND